MTDADSIRVDAGVVTTITFDRPEAMNSLTPAAMDALEAAIDGAEDEARVLVLRGAGDRAFVAGASIDHMSEFDEAQAREFAEQGHRITRKLETFPAPVIAAINGYALGAGIEMALACDLRIASERAVLGEPELDIGVIPGWGGTQRLPRVVGEERARRMIYFAERVDAQDAHEIGLVGDVVAHDELDEYLRDMAAELAERPRQAMQAAKASLNRRFAVGIEEGLAYEREQWTDLFGTHDQREGMAAFLDDREPEFE